MMRRPRQTIPRVGRALRPRVRHRDGSQRDRRRSPRRDGSPAARTKARRPKRTRDGSQARSHHRRAREWARRLEPARTQNKGTSFRAKQETGYHRGPPPRAHPSRAPRRLHRRFARPRGGRFAHRSEPRALRVSRCPAASSSRAKCPANPCPRPEDTRCR